MCSCVRMYARLMGISRTPNRSMGSGGTLPLQPMDNGSDRPVVVPALDAL